MVSYNDQFIQDFNKVRRDVDVLTRRMLSLSSTIQPQTVKIENTNNFPAWIDQPVLTTSDVEFNSITLTTPLTSGNIDSITTSQISDLTTASTGITKLGTVTVGDIDAIANYFTNGDITKAVIDALAITTVGTLDTGDVRAVDSIGKVASKASGDVFYYDSGLQRLAKGSDGQVLTLASGVPTWDNATAIVASIDDISDVTITSAADKDVLYYDNASSLWKNKTLAAFKTSLSLAKADVGLSNVENTALSTYIDQAVKTTSSPTFALLTTTDDVITSNLSIDAGHQVFWNARNDSGINKYRQSHSAFVIYHNTSSEQLEFYNASAGTAGGSVSFSQTMVIDDIGNWHFYGAVINNYASADYGAGWASVALRSSPTDGMTLIRHNSNAGVDTTRIYVYSNGGWHYINLT